jgi:glycosyltransferase involved in cell wall biosynthesis
MRNLTSNSRDKIAFVHNLLIHYRVPLFNLIDRSSICFLFHFADVDKRIPRILSSKKVSLHFKYRIWRSFRIKEGLYISPFLPFELINKRYNTYVASWILNPDSIVTFAIAKLLRRPFVLWEERYDWTPTFFENLLKPIQTMIYRSCNAIVVPGSKSKAFFDRLTANPWKIFIAPNASLPFERTNYDRVRLLKGKLGSTKKILFVGNLISAYRVDLIIKSLKLLKDSEVRLIICGEGPLKTDLVNLTTQLKLTDRVIFTGFVSDTENYYPLADVVVVPFEGIGPWGLVLNEAASFGKPIIASDRIGASYDIIKDGVNGFLLHENTPGQLAVLISKVLENRNFSDNAKKMSPKIMECYSFKKMSEGFLDAIKHANYKT